MDYLTTRFKEESADIPSIPPGFGSPMSFTLDRIENGSLGPFQAPTSATLQSKINDQKTVPCETFSKCLRQRTSINYSQFDGSSDEDSDAELLSQLTMQKGRSKCSLPKGTFRGCPECSSCQKVTAKWQPEKARKPIIDEAPVFYPTEEEFEDTLKYIASIRPKAESYGICLVVPPPSWKSPCPLKEKDAWENHKFFSRMQRIDQLQNRQSTRMKSKRRRVMGSNGHAERFGFETGPEFTLKSFESFANDFKDQYFRLQENDGHSNCKPSVDDVEGEYWRMVERPTEEIEVLYGADIDTGSFGSGFPKTSISSNSRSDERYAKSGWNLNNFPRLAGSVLAFEESDISGVVVPWLYVGMCFSSFCWHVEDHHFYSLNYLHWGEPKVWYGVPGSDAWKLETAMKKHLPDLFEEQPDLLHNLVTQFSPSTLRSEGVPVFRCVQRPGQFVLTFPRAYHAGFNSGFNCAEAVNVAPLDWLPHGQFAVELYRDQKRKISVSHDKLLLGAAREAVRAQWNILFLGKKTTDNLRWKDACGTNGILAKVLRAHVEAELYKREKVCSSSSSSQTRKMDTNFDADTERECSVCHYDLHLSAVGCSCSSERFACLDHGKEMCACPWDKKFFLFRYQIGELNILLDAVGGKLSAVHKWARSDLGLSLSSYMHKDKPKQHDSINPIQSKAAELVESINNTVSTVAQDAKMPDLIVSAGALLSKSSSNGCFEVKRDDLAEQQSSDYQGEQNHAVKPSAGFAVIHLSDDEEDETCKVSENKTKVGVTENHADVIFARPMDQNDRMVTPSHCDKDRSLETPETDARVMDDDSDVNLASKKVSSDCHSIGGSFLQPSQSPASMNAISGRSIDTNNNSCLNANVKGDSVAHVGQFVTLGGADRSSRPGPRMARVVRRINSVVQPLALGVVLPGRLWSCEKAIFPKGYRSRVRYLSVLDPSQMCYYVCEILDAGLQSPLFMVQVESCPTEAFIHLSASRCWDLVRERLNNEIRKHHTVARAGIPALQPPGSLDGLEMFGLTSPATIKAIEATDVDRVCVEYWKSKDRGVVVDPQITAADPIFLRGQSGSADSAAIFRGLLPKLNPEELQFLGHALVNDDLGLCSKEEALKLVRDEIEARRKPL
ncbi:transcription factor jumonji (jmj) family protein / zinc finger (C5HC2 type) family protein isoform X2 [Wolffia australiana]